LTLTNVKQICLFVAEVQKKFNSKDSRFLKLPHLDLDPVLQERVAQLLRCDPQQLHRSIAQISRS
jgi:hypothetical protein